MTVAKSKGEKGTSRMEMVRQALADLGANAKPLALQEQIKAKHGETLPTQIISNYKFQINNRKSSRPAGRGRRAASAGTLKVEDFQMIRGLVSRLGADQVKKLVEVVG
jgi:hypothetical protein